MEEAEQQPLADVPVPGAPPEVQREVSAAAEQASVDAFRIGIAIATALVALGGILGLIGIVNPRRRVAAKDCPGGQLVGATEEGSRQSPCDWGRGNLENLGPSRA